jgi:hypothetical protein
VCLVRSDAALPWLAAAQAAALDVPALWTVVQQVLLPLVALPLHPLPVLLQLQHGALHQRLHLQVLLQLQCTPVGSVCPQLKRGVQVLAPWPVLPHLLMA